MATTPEFTTILPPFERDIVYDRETREYAMILDGDVVGYARTYHEAEVSLDTLVHELLRTYAAEAAQAQQVEALVAPHHDLSDEQEDELAEARVVAAALAPSDRPVIVGSLADGTPITSGRTTHGHPCPLRVATEQGYLLVSTRGLAGRWAGSNLHLDAAQLAAPHALPDDQYAALAGLLADGTLRTLLQLAQRWEQAAWRWSRRALSQVAA